MVSLSSVSRLARGATVAVLVLVAAPLGVARAEAPSQPTLERTVAYLQGAQNTDGGFGASAEAPSDPDFSAWAALALAAAGINPQDERAPGGRSVYRYLSEQAGALQLVPDFERALLVADAAGAPPRDFGGRDLVGAILSSRLPDGSLPYRPGEAIPDVNDTSFAVLALSLVAEPRAQEAAARGAAWLAGVQNSDGSWPPGCPARVPACTTSEREAAGEVDATAAAVEALNAAGQHDAPAQVAALRWLHQAQRPDGGLPELPDEGVSNAASTAWAAQALWAAGVEPSSWTQAGGDPLTYMASLQQPDGSIDWRPGQPAEPVWMTAYVLPALSGRALPIQAVPRDAPPATGSEPAPGTPPGATPGKAEGAGSTSVGLRAGGGGAGAPLFSRPEPQSRGHQVGGARDAEVPARRPKGGTHARSSGPSGSGGGEGVRGGNAPPPAAAGPRGADGPARRVDGLLLASSAGPAAAPGLAAAAAGIPGAGAALAIGLASLGAFLLGAALERRRPGAAP